MANVTTSLNKIKEEIARSALEPVFKSVAGYDLEQAGKAYEAQAFKACIIMLGAVLEGVMLGTIRRPDVLNRLRADPSPPSVINRLGLRDPDLADKVADRLDFEDYKAIIRHLIPDIESQRVEDIQVFRNAVHPWKAVKEPNIYANYDRIQERTTAYILMLTILVPHILSWNP